MEPIKIVMAEDNEIYLAGLEKVLRGSGLFEVAATARNGKELLDCVRGCKADVVITDIQMPVMNGIEATRILIKEDPLLKVLALTMHSSEFLIVDMLEAGAMGYIDKITSEERLEEAIQTVHEGLHYHCPATSMRLAKLIAASRARLHREDVVFTGEELKVIRLLCEEYATKQIASALSLSQSMIDKMRKRIQEKMGVKSVAGIVVFALRKRLLDG